MTSYFICGDAAEAYPQMILSGDRNMGGGTGAAITSSGQPASSYGQIGTNSVCQSTGGNGTTVAFPWGWTSSDLHQKAGNLCIADGSVQQATSSGLMTSLLNATNGASSANPIYNMP